MLIEYNHIIMVVAVVMAYVLVDRVVAMRQCIIDCIPWTVTNGSVAVV